MTNKELFDNLEEDELREILNDFIFKSEDELKARIKNITENLTPECLEVNPNTQEISLSLKGSLGCYAIIPENIQIWRKTPNEASPEDFSKILPKRAFSPVAVENMYIAGRPIIVSGDILARNCYARLSLPDVQIPLRKVRPLSLEIRANTSRGDYDFTRTVIDNFHNVVQNLIKTGYEIDLRKIDRAKTGELIAKVEIPENKNLRRLARDLEKIYFGDIR